MSKNVFRHNQGLKNGGPIKTGGGRFRRFSRPLRFPENGKNGQNSVKPAKFTFEPKTHSKTDFSGFCRF